MDTFCIWRRESVGPRSVPGLTVAGTTVVACDKEGLLQDWSGGEVLALEAAVRKMGRILLQVGPSAKADGHASRLLNVSFPAGFPKAPLNLANHRSPARQCGLQLSRSPHLQDNNADAATKEWLINMMSNQRQGSLVSHRASRRFSAFDRPRRSIMGALSRLASIRPPGGLVPAAVHTNVRLCSNAEVALRWQTSNSFLKRTTPAVYVHAGTAFCRDSALVTTKRTGVGS